MEVWLVEGLDYEDHFVDSVWSTKELAEQREAALQQNQKKNRYRRYNWTQYVYQVNGPYVIDTARELT